MKRTTQLKLSSAAFALIVLGVHSCLLVIELLRVFACAEYGPSCELPFPLLPVLTLGMEHLVGKWGIFLGGPIWAAVAYIITIGLLRRKHDSTIA